MMRSVRVAVISDIHANLYALEAVLREIERERPDELWCLGDLVGYGPRPNECCSLVRERADVCLIGNHDLGVLGRIDLDVFSPEAAVSARWTDGVLEPEARAYLESLSSSAVRAGVGLYHASPRDPVWEYVLSPAVALAALAATEEDAVLVGHSHVALAIVDARGEVAGGLAPAGTAVPFDAARWLLNPGSVGQPRDGDWRAAWLLLDLAEGRAEFRRVEYDVGRTQDEIRAAGFPEALAERLAHGV
jgi:diadenosine tetraphosphatase ApaH/serine/threonine PP2A family protein phosphatase